MPSLAELPEVMGFFSYSREDDADSHGRLSALRDAIQRELGSQLGLPKGAFHLFQDREAIAPGKYWETEINKAVQRSSFFIPIVTPRAVNSHHCRFEFESFLARERALGRDDLVFPILYISVPALESDAQWRSHPVLSIVGRRQYIDWRPLRHVDVQTTVVGETIDRFCSKIVKALFESWSAPEEVERLGTGATRQRSGADSHGAGETWVQDRHGETGLQPASGPLDKPIGSNSQAAIAYLDRAREYIASGDYDRAIADATGAIRLDPTMAAAFSRRAAACYNKGDTDRAIADATQAIRLDPQLAAAYDNRAASYLRKGDHKRAIADASEAIRLNPAMASAYARRAGAHLGIDANESTIADASEAIRLDPTMAAAYVNRAAAYVRTRDYDRAIADATEAVRLNPALATAYANRARAYRGRGDFALASADAAMAARLNRKASI